jgi:hypothetical protein
VTILVPDLIYAGDTVIFDVPAFKDAIGTTIDSGTYTLNWYARTNTASEGATITGVAEGDGWRITIPASTSANFDAGLWTWQAVATEDTNNTQYTAGRGQFTVKATASYTGTPGAFDDRSRAEIDLENVDAAIRTLSSGGMVQEYSIGGRSLRRYKMTELLELRSTLQNEVAMERRRERIRQGLGNPGLAKVRFR